MAPRFTVLLPAHNREDVVGYAIRSVLAQTESSFELFVVGDGCSDNTANVVTAFDDHRIRWFNLPKGPHSGYNNRNIALAEARGEYVAYAAHDDLLAPDHLVTLGNVLDVGREIEWVYSRPLWVSPDGLILPLSGNLLNRDELDVFLNQANFIPSPCVVHRRSCFQTCGFWPEGTARMGDWLLWRAIIERGGRGNLAYCAVPTTFHFKAVWKESLEQGVPSVRTISQIAKRSAWWPPALRFAVDPDQPEQAALSRHLESGGAWIETVRRAVLQVVERLAWDTTALLHDLEEQRAQLRACSQRSDELWNSLRETASQIECLEGENTRQREQLQRQHQEAAALGQHLHNVLSSRSWRMTYPLRKLRRMVTDQGPR